MSTPIEHVAAQKGAWDFTKASGYDRWWQRHLVRPTQLAMLISDAEKLNRIHKHFQYGADKSLCENGDKLDVTVGKLVAEVKKLRSKLESAGDKRLNHIERLNNK